MATLPEDVRTLIAATTAITSLVSTRIHYNHIPEAAIRPHVWYRVARDEEELCLDGAGGMHEADLDMECVGVTEGSAQAVADAVKARLHGFTGAIGSSAAKGIFVHDKDDTYVPFAIRSDEGAHVVSYSVNLWYTT